MAFVGMSETGETVGRKKLRDISNRNELENAVLQGAVLHGKNQPETQGKPPRDGSFSIGGPGAFLIAAGLLLASGSTLIEMLHLPITSVFGLVRVGVCRSGGWLSIFRAPQI